MKLAKVDRRYIDGPVAGVAAAMPENDNGNPVLTLSFEIDTWFYERFTLGCDYHTFRETLLKVHS